MSPGNFVQENPNAVAVVVGNNNSDVKAAIEKAKEAIREGYDFDEGQSLVFTVEEDGETITITQNYDVIGDDQIAAHDALRKVTLATVGKQTSIKTASLVADADLFDKTIKSIDGYDEPLPENFRELYPSDEKQTGVRRLLAVKVVRVTDKSAKKTKRSWSNQQQTAEYKVLFYYNNAKAEALVRIKAAKDAELLTEYDRIKNGIDLADSEDLDNNDLQIPSTIAAKGELFERIFVSQSGYASRIPLNHRAALVTAHFEGNASFTAKKSSN